MKLLPALSCLMLTACAQSSVSTADGQAFAPVRHVLETNCVHCHGEGRLDSMPPMDDTRRLAKLIGSGWIVPGEPEKSRFFQVVTFPDEVPGAMPPSGHAIDPKDMAILRAWIKSGARVPATNSKLRPQGPLPRST